MAITENTNIGFSIGEGVPSETVDGTFYIDTKANKILLQNGGENPIDLGITLKNENREVIWDDRQNKIDPIAKKLREGNVLLGRENQIQGDGSISNFVAGRENLSRVSYGTVLGFRNNLNPYKSGHAANGGAFVAGAYNGSSGAGSATFGQYNYTLGKCSITAGTYNTATFDDGSAFGQGLITNKNHRHVFGKWNDATNTDKTIYFEIGGGNANIRDAISYKNQLYYQWKESEEDDDDSIIHKPLTIWDPRGEFTNHLEQHQPNEEVKYVKNDYVIFNHKLYKRIGKGEITAFPDPEDKERDPSTASDYYQLYDGDIRTVLYYKDGNEYKTLSSLEYNEEDTDEEVKAKEITKNYEIYCDKNCSNYCIAVPTRRNIFTIDENGNVWAQGGIKIGTETVATESWVEGKNYITDKTYDYLNSITSVITSTSSLTEDSWQNNDSSIATVGAISKFVENKLTCLVESTPINMYDGTYKNIEDVKTGDIVLSYNPVTKEQVPAIVLTKIQTGSERGFNTDMFSNGKSLTSFGYEGIYDSKTGIIRNLENINPTFIGLDVSGENITWTLKRTTRFYGDKKARYHILTSNNLLFANDILIGALPFDKYEVLVDYNIPMSDELKEVWKQDAEEYNTYNTNIITNAEFQKDMASAYVDCRKFTDIIRNNRNLLNQSDYKSHKYAEGKLTEEEWQESNIKREEYRKAINEAQVQLQENEALRTRIWNEQRKGRTLRDIFELCCERDNALYEKVKEYYCQSEKDD